MSKYEYLKKHEERMNMRDGRRGRRRDRESYDGYDGRNPYGSAGGYVSSSRRGRDRDYEDYEMGNDYDYRERDYRGGSNYDSESRGRDYNYDGERYRDYGPDYEYEDVDKKYKRDLKKHIEKLEENSRFKMPKEQIINRAKSMSIDFDDYSENEFYLMYLLFTKMFKEIPNNNDFNVYIKMVKEFLDSDDEKATGADKVCAYFYEIIKGGK